MPRWSHVWNCLAIDYRAIMSFRALAPLILVAKPPKKRAKYMIAWTEVVLHSLWCCSQTFLEGILISGFQSYSSNTWEYTSQNYFQTLYLSLCLGNTVDGKILHRRMPPQYHYLFGHWKWCRIFPSTVWCVLCTSFIFGYGISTNVPW